MGWLVLFGGGVEGFGFRFPNPPPLFLPRGSQVLAAKTLRNGGLARGPQGAPGASHAFHRCRCVHAGLHLSASGGPTPWASPRGFYADVFSAFGFASPGCPPVGGVNAFNALDSTLGVQLDAHCMHLRIMQRHMTHGSVVALRLTVHRFDLPTLNGGGFTACKP